MLSRALPLAIAALPFLAGPASAHHSYAMFDGNKVITLKGTVDEFRWTNPHVALFVKVEGAPEAVWAVELTSPGNLTRLGWARSSVKPGDKVEVEINPLRDGQHGGGFRSLKLVATGQVLKGRLYDIGAEGGKTATP
ncbi:DUF6152 family protein [Sphingomonas sp. MMS24-J13]|uniref:DUF6152 family protein n=1 Tax=Sphingomonas sp. MMS24-J13 TaxID=3238686 RepID=UPI00384D1E71